MKHHAVRRDLKATHRAHRCARGIGAMHAGHRNRALAGLTVIDGDDAAPVDAPRYFILVLAGGNAGVAFDATIGVTKKFHSRHDASSLRRTDLAESCLWLLHARYRIEAVGGERVHAFAEHVGIRT